MSHLDQNQFIQIMQRYKIKNLASFVGYEVNPQLVLDSGRKVSTITWNPFIFALVLGRTDLYDFITKVVNFNLKKLMELDFSNLNDVNQNQMTQEDKEAEGIFQTIKLMIENNSCLLKNLFNDLSYLIKNSQLKRIIPLIVRSPQASKNLEIFLQSKAFKSLFFHKVKSVSLLKYKSSFEFFFEKHFSGLKVDQECRKVMAKFFVQQPFNASFGTYLILNNKKANIVFENVEQLIIKCTELRDFDVYRLGLLADADLATMSQTIGKEYQGEKLEPFTRFIDEYRRKLSNYDSTKKKIQQLFTKIKEGDLSGFKKRIGSDIPKEALSTITGFSIPDYNIQIKSLGQQVTIRTEEMNPLELACALGQFKIASYLIEELGLRSSKDFQIGKASGSLEQLQFMTSTIFRQDSQVFQLLLQQSNVWNYEDFLAILTFLKQTKWFSGYSIALESKFAQENFLNRMLQERFRFVRDILIMPYKIDIVDGSVSDMSGIFDEDQPEGSVPYSSRRNLLNDNEKKDLRRAIKARLCEQPYSGAFLFQEFAPRRDTYQEVAELHIPADDPVDSLNHLKISINNLADYDLHDYIDQTQGGLVQIIERFIEYSDFGGAQDQGSKSYNESFVNELRMLIHKIENHPTMQLRYSQNIHKGQQNQI